MAWYKVTFEMPEVQQGTRWREEVQAHSEDEAGGKIIKTQASRGKKAVIVSVKPMEMDAGARDKALEKLTSEYHRTVDPLKAQIQKANDTYDQKRREIMKGNFQEAIVLSAKFSMNPIDWQKTSWGMLGSVVLPNGKTEKIRIVKGDITPWAWNYVGRMEGGGGQSIGECQQDAQDDVRARFPKGRMAAVLKSKFAPMVFVNFASPAISTGSIWKVWFKKPDGKVVGPLEVLAASESGARAQAMAGLGKSHPGVTIAKVQAPKDKWSEKSPHKFVSPQDPNDSEGLRKPRISRIGLEASMTVVGMMAKDILKTTNREH